MNVAVLTVSDRVSRGEAEDGSGDLLEELLRADGFEVERALVPDERKEIAAALRDLAERVQIILTTGGTGLAPRDVTPDLASYVAAKTVEPAPAARPAARLGVSPTAAGPGQGYRKGRSGRSLVAVTATPPVWLPGAGPGWREPAAGVHSIALWLCYRSS